MIATYRLQLSPSFGFAEALAVTPYLRELGVSHLYLSPVLEARRGSTHGYDVVDPTRVSLALGGEEGLRALGSAGLGLILDIVPNHMAASEEENALWRDPATRQRVFDLDEQSDAHRRFLDVDELAGVRVEDADVFALTHGRILRLVHDGLVQGVRVDHVDGLAAPRAYLEQLRAEGVERVWVEKILGRGEHLRDWPVEGTTGYEFANDAQALFVDPAGERVLSELAGESRPWPEVAFAAKLEQVQTTFLPELERLRRLYDHPQLGRALASLEVYRTYVEPASGRVEAADRAALGALPDDLRAILLLEERGHDEFVTRFQQTTGAVAAKGVEDTAFYRYTRLLALNEVGGDPGRFGIDVEAFHAANARRPPGGLLAGTTHDTKRSADVRARIGVLAGIAEEWAEHVGRWRDWARHEGGAPDRSEEQLIYQTLVGAWPLEPARLGRYLEKALREEKRHSSWVEPDRDWERRVRGFYPGLLDDPRFRADFEPFAARIAALGERAAREQLILRFTSPGVPDIYQGDEHPLLLLVDPDNRVPVHWSRRSSAKAELVRTLLALRARRPDAFAGDYEPLPAGADTCAFRRGGEVAVAVPTRGGEPVWEPPDGGWREVVPGRVYERT